MLPISLDHAHAAVHYERDYLFAKHILGPACPSEDAGADHQDTANQGLRKDSRLISAEVQDTS
jgi:hypothetical protein